MLYLMYILNTTGCLWHLCASCGHFCGLRVGEMVGKWAGKQWSREVPFTYQCLSEALSNCLAMGI